jgi:nucleotide-binding universal stress UspA family protein
VRNPLRSEPEAFNFLLVTLVSFAAIALASVLGGAWAGVPVFVVATLAVVFLYFRRPSGDPPPEPLPSHHVGGPQDKRILVIANETVGGDELRRCLRSRSEGFNTEVLVVAPALNTPLRTWVSDEDPARAAAEQRLQASIARLRDGGVEVRGEVGDGDPLQAIEDGLRTFGADEVILSTHPEGRSNWLERGVVEAARQRFAIPITHVVVDLERQSEEVRSE